MRLLLSLVAFCVAAPAFAQEPAKLKVLFLGDNAGHRPAERFKQLQPVFAKRGIDLTYTDKTDDLNAKNLAGYDVLMIYANHTKITPEQEKALLDFVEGGKGFVPLHCASYCFLNSPKYIALVGAQFRSHGTGTFRTDVVKPDHPIMQGYQPFSSWDETYVHTKHNDKDRTVLEVRTDGDLKEPWTWVRTQGKGRVFYTAWGHDQRTWGHEGFQNLVERGVRWAAGQEPALAGPHFEKPKMTEPRKDVAPFEYADAKVPFYPPRGQPKAGPLSKMQKPLSVEESIKHYVTPVDFEVKVFVTEEKLGGKPIAMNWDEQGRLWVSITVDYPNDLQRQGEGHDRIVVCEDTDGAGVCTKVTTFADKLSIPTSILPYAGGIIVHQAPVTLFLKDTDGDGKADVRQELIRGWSTGDTHAGPSNLHYGFDNWVYGSVGYAGFRGEVNGERLTFRQGFYRFKLEKSDKADELKVTKLEFLRSTSNNTWGLCFDEAGNLFGSTANGCPIVHMPIPNRYYEKVKGLTPTVLQNIAPDYHFEPITDKVRQVDWHGGFTAASNIAVYTARTYPREYWNRTAFISDPTGHLTAAMTLHPNGADYRAQYGWNLVASDDEWAAPIDAQVGPDGHVWVIDWYNFIVQHNPTPAGFTTGKGAAYVTPLRDKTHGRIYRIVYTKAKPEPRLNLKDATPEKLVETLKHHNLTWRLHAQRLLVDRGKPDSGKAIADGLLKEILAEDKDAHSILIHKMWALQGLGGYQTSDNAKMALSLALRAASPDIRKTAADILAEEARRPKPGYGNSGETLPYESDPAVRLALLLHLSEVTTEEAVGMNLFQLVCRQGKKPGEFEWWSAIDQLDRSEWEALTIATCVHDSHFLKWYAQVAPLKQPVPARVARLVETASRHLAARGSADGINRLLSNLRPAVPDAPSYTAYEPIIAGLSAAWPTGKAAKLDDESEKAIGQLLAKLPAASRGKLLKLAATWGVKGLDAQLAEITKGAFATLANAKATDADRIAAAQQVIEFRPDDPDAAKSLLDAVTEKSSPALAAGIFEALSQSKAKNVGVAVVERMKDLPPAARPAAVRLVLAKSDSAKAFLDAVEKGTLRFDMLALDQRTALASHPEKDISERAKKLLALGGGLPSPDRQKVIEELKPILTATGSVENGKKLFTQHCAKCHKYGGEGTQIGPDLTGFAVHPKEELLIHIIDPARSVEGNFKLFRVLTADDRTIIGILGAQTGTSVEVIDAEAKRHALAKEDIVSLKETDKSLMPEGFEKVMKPAELADLLEFLTQKGKFVPLPLDKVATAVSTKGMFNDESSPVERLIFPDWKPKVFEGVPFVLVDPEKDKRKNVVLLHSENGSIPPKMPKSVSLPFTGKAKTIHILGGVGGWAAPYSADKTVSMIVRLTYEDGKTEDHELRNAVHIADYIRKVDVPESKFAFALRNQQVRYLAVTPKRPDTALKSIELVKGPDRTAPIVMAVTVETP
jgi:putative membrane-bound dehydrogenase-like protein